MDLKDIPDLPKVSTDDMVTNCRKRRRQILDLLPPKELKEYLRLGRLIKEIKVQEAQAQGSKLFNETFKGDIPSMMKAVAGTIKTMSKQFERLSIRSRRLKLIEFLGTHGPSQRKDICRATSIPPGTLSKLLLEKTFKRVDRGLWTIADDVKKKFEKNKTKFTAAMKLLK